MIAIHPKIKGIKMRLGLLTLLSFNLFAAERWSPEPSDSSKDESDFCEVAMASFRGPDPSELDRHIRPHLMEVIRKSPKNTEPVAARGASGDDNDVVSDKRMHDMIISAIKQSFEQKECIIARQEERIKEKYSGKKVAAIVAIFTTISTVVSSICSTVVALHSKK